MIPKLSNFRSLPALVRRSVSLRRIKRGILPHFPTNKSIQPTTCKIKNIILTGLLSIRLAYSKINRYSQYSCIFLKHAGRRSCLGKRSVDATLNQRHYMTNFANCRTVDVFCLLKTKLVFCRLQAATATATIFFVPIANSLLLIKKLNGNFKIHICF